MRQRLVAAGLLLACSLAVDARASDAGTELAGAPDAGLPAAAPPAVPLVAVLNLESNKAAADNAPSVGALVASALAASPKLRLITAQDISTAVGLDRQKQLLSKDGTCSESACLAELSGAVGARYVVTGRLDRLGEKYVLSTSAFDAAKAVSLGKPTAEAATEDQLPVAAREVGRQLLVALGAAPPDGTPGVAAAAQAPPAEPIGMWLSLKFGNTFVTSLTALGLGGDVDVGYALTKAWIGFLQIGVTFVRATADGESGRLNVVPTVLGIRHLYRVDKDLQPYWGVGLGVQLAFGQFGFFSDSGPLPNIHAILGLQYLLSKHVGLLLDASTNVAQAILGLTQNGTGNGFNLQLSVGVTFRF